MLTINLTPEQAGILYDVIRAEFNKLAKAYCEHTAEETNLAYSAMCAIRTAREADFYDRAIDDGGENPFLITKREYLLDRHLTLEDLKQQGI